MPRSIAHTQRTQHNTGTCSRYSRRGNRRRPNFRPQRNCSRAQVKRSQGNLEGIRTDANFANKPESRKVCKQAGKLESEQDIIPPHITCGKSSSSPADHQRCASSFWMVRGREVNGDGLGEGGLRGHRRPKRRRIPLHTMINTEVAAGRVFCSFEYSPARDPDPEDLFARVRRMTKRWRPLWVDVTWGFGDVGARTLEVCRRIRKELDMEVLMHLILTDTPTQDLDDSLAKAKAAGVRSILALRGYTQAGYKTWQALDPSHGTSGYIQAAELVAHIRRTHGDTFSIGVAGFPEGHPESKEDRYIATEAELCKDVMWLKEKVDAGADFVVCQFTFDPRVFEAFVARCRRSGITVPILPGIMPISEHASTRLLSHTWGVRLPANMERRLRLLDEDRDVDAVRKLGLRFVSELCHMILADRTASGTCPGLHFYVYDSEYEVGQVLEALKERGWDMAQLVC